MDASNSNISQTAGSLSKLSCFSKQVKILNSQNPTSRYHLIHFQKFMNASISLDSTFILFSKFVPNTSGLGYSTVLLQLVNILNDIDIQYNKQLKIAAVFLDIEKAFNRMWHAGLIFKLIVTRVPIQIVNIVK